MNSKKRKFWWMAFLPASAEAYLMQILQVFVIVTIIAGVIAVIVYLVWSFIAWWNGITPANKTDATTNQVSTVIQLTDGQLLPSDVTSNTPPGKYVACTNFYLAFGALPTGPWVQKGWRSALENDTNMTAYATVNTESEYDYYINICGQWEYVVNTLITNFDCYVTNEDGSVDNTCLNTNDDGTVTDDSLGFSTTVYTNTCPPGNVTPLRTVGIERTTDLIHWTLICTNICPTNSPQFYLDTNAPLPAAFYRAKDLDADGR